METVRVLIAREAGTEDLPLPAYQTAGASGADLHCAEPEPVVIAPGEIRLVSTGISVSVPAGFEAQIRPRSGLALEHGLSMVNAPGTIDSDYRGVIKLILINHGREAFTASRGMRLAQMIIQPVLKAEFEVVEKLDETSRAGQGFGHTGFGISR